MQQDLSQFEKSLTAVLKKDLLDKISTMDKNQIKAKFLEIIHSDNVCISKEAVKKYEMGIEQQKSLTNLQYYVYNIGLKGEGLGSLR